MKTESIQLQTAIQRLLDQEKYDETIRFGKEMLFVPLFQYIAKCAADELKKGEIIKMDIAQVYNDNKNSVYRLALTYLHSQAEAEDICHDVFIKMMEHKTVLFPGKERAWLLTVTANECKNRLKFWKRHGLEELADDIPVKGTQSSDILETVMSLSVKERTVVYLYYYEGYTTDEIAGILKITASAVRSRMERARKHLKSKLEGELS